jgi:beta-lactamase regulating signal transducer with metallopeptidase domain
MEKVPLVGRRPWLPALPIGVVVVVSVGLGGYECVRQLHRLYRLQLTLRSLGEPPAGHVDNLARFGLRAVQVVSTDEVLCFCIGLLRPRIVVSTGLVNLLDRAELDAVLAHEASHQRRRDPLRLMVASVAIRGLFFVPALTDLARAARLTTEVEADAAAVDRYGYSNMLRALKTVLEAVPLTPAGASAMVASDLMSERVQALGGDHPRFIIRWRRLVASIAALVVLLTLGLAVPSPTKTPPLVPVHRIVVPSRS